MSFTADIEVTGGTAIHRLHADGRPLTRGGLLERLQHDPEARRWLAAHIAAQSFAAVFFEFPALSAATLDRQAELAIVDAPELAPIEADPHAFARELAGADEVAAFGNLGGDAFLVVPTERARRAAYGHLAAFLRGAPPEQQDALWKRVGDEARGRIGERPLWLSTAGMGVSWLHVRLDARPKYYRHAPYRVPP